MLTPEDFKELKPTFEEIRRLLSAARIAGVQNGRTVPDLISQGFWYRRCSEKLSFGAPQVTPAPFLPLIRA